MGRASVEIPNIRTIDRVSHISSGWPPRKHRAQGQIRPDSHKFQISFGRRHPSDVVYAATEPVRMS